MGSTKNICISGQSILHTHYQQKPLQHAFIDYYYYYLFNFEATVCNLVYLTCKKQKLAKSKALQLKLLHLILGFWQCAQIFIYYLLSILIICKQTDGYIYQVAFREFPFAITCSEKEQTRRISFLQEQITELYQLFDDL